jgi:hypothetical protein
MGLGAVAWWRASTGRAVARRVPLGWHVRGDPYAAADGRERRAEDCRRARRGDRFSGCPRANSKAERRGCPWARVLVPVRCLGCGTGDTRGASDGSQPSRITTHVSQSSLRTRRVAERQLALLHRMRRLRMRDEHRDDIQLPYSSLVAHCFCSTCWSGFVKYSKPYGNAYHAIPSET